MGETDIVAGKTTTEASFDYMTAISVVGLKAFATCTSRDGYGCCDILVEALS